MAPQAAKIVDTFPKFLLVNAAVRGKRPAIRQKDLGIWQTWTWADVEEEVRALALGLKELGLKRGDKIAIIGSNKPRLYWTMAAAQSIGAIPVPVYAGFGRRRDGLCAGARRCHDRGGREPGAGRQGALDLRPAADDHAHCL